MTAPSLDVNRHPIRGAIWGLFLGIGLAFILIDRAVIAFGTSKVYIVILIGILLGVIWGSFAPAKAAKQPEIPVKAEVKTSDSQDDLVEATAPSEEEEQPDDA